MCILSTTTGLGMVLSILSKDFEFWNSLPDRKYPAPTKLITG